MDHVDTFVEHRPLLFNIAYRMLGSGLDAEDMVQDSFLRWRQADPAQVETPRAYLVTIVTRLCLDFLRSARVRRETYPGPWLPEMVASERLAGPADTVAQRETLSLSFLLLLERLTPAERAAFLLRDVFDYEYEDIAGMLERQPAAVRQLASRARRKLDPAALSGRQAPAGPQAALTGRFLASLLEGDLDGLLSLLSADVSLRADGGGKAAAATRPVLGAERVARFFLGLAAQMPPGTELRSFSLNGGPGLLVLENGRVTTAGVLEVGQGRIEAIYMMRNPDKLVALAAALL